MTEFDDAVARGEAIERIRRDQRERYEKRSGLHGVGPTEDEESPTPAELNREMIERQDAYLHSVGITPEGDGLGRIVAAAGWSVPAEQVYPHIEIRSDDEQIEMPPITVRRGESWHEIAERLHRHREEARRRLAEILGIPVEAIDGLNAKNGTKRLTLRPGHWEYGVREADGEIIGAGFDSAQAAFNAYGLSPGDQIVRRWVSEPGEWEQVK